MSIKPIDILQAINAARPTSQGKAATDVSDHFEKLLARSTAPGSSSREEAQVLAQWARLEMLRGSLDFISEQDEQTTFSLPLPVASAYPPPNRVNIDFPAASQAPPASGRPLQPLRQSAPPIMQIAEDTASRFEMDPALVKAVIKAESDFDPSVVSKAGAQGLMQLMPETAQDLGVSDPFDPEQNVQGGTRYLKWLHEKYNGDIDRTLAAYNWGPGNVDRKGIDSLPEETRNYLSRVKRFRETFKA